MRKPIACSVLFLLLVTLGLVWLLTMRLLSTGPVDPEHVRIVGFNSKRLMLEIEGTIYQTERSRSLEQWMYYALVDELEGKGHEIPPPEIAAVRRTGNPAFPYVVQIGEEVVRVPTRTRWIRQITDWIENN